MIILRILIKRYSVNFTMSWLLIVYISPLIGVIGYLLLIELRLERYRSKRIEIMKLSVIKWFKNFGNCSLFYKKKNNGIAGYLFQLCEHRQGIKGTYGNYVQLFNDTYHTINEIIRDINLAKNNIEMVFYIWQMGGLVDQVVESLIKASNRGVYCRIMLDHVGSISFFSTPCYSRMIKAGINIVQSLHINIFRFFLRRIDFRQHRKIVLIDNYISYVGSMNMVDPLLFKQSIGKGKWIDIMVRMEGPVTAIMSIIYSYDWALETGENTLPPPISYNKKNFLSIKNKYNNSIQIIASGPGCNEGVIHQALLTVIYTARKHLIITTPYLIPSDDLLFAICTAAQRGVEVHIIIPKNSDSVLVSWASRIFFYELLDAGVLIHQFEGGLLHSKSILVDKKLSLIGTVNLDMRSLWLNFEITLVIDDKKFGKNLYRLQNNYIKKSNLVDINVWSNRPYWQRVVEKLFYFFTPLLSLIVVIIF